MLVVDASVAFVVCGARDGFAVFGDEALVAPPLMWSETRSAIHELAWRKEIEPDEALAIHAQLELCPVECRWPEGLGEAAWEIADQLGWAKTYDAEYVALARLLDCRAVTLDVRLRRGADRLGLVIGLDEL